MKTRILSARLLFILLIVFFVRCTPSHQDYVSSAKEIVSTGKWSVDYYYSGQNQTSSFYNYQFSFQNNGIVICDLGSSVVTGTWSTIHDVNSNEIMSINIDCQQPNIMELNTKWSVTQLTTTEVGMQNGSSSQLRIKRI
ncbi:MAG TPA: hypothetical protein VFQ58_09655 [Flavisolibacter sp.]|jgi:hypothetical protein|nr:hypothetical protein [Flavisolibacter sp.]